ncbi:hypothetical protein [Rhodococcus sp. ABRD24]|nr:hypothetical protein [Rhodococcus sp. ABRD24]
MCPLRQVHQVVLVIGFTYVLTHDACWRNGVGAQPSQASHFRTVVA